MLNGILEQNTNELLDGKQVYTISSPTGSVSDRITQPTTAFVTPVVEHWLE